jgi:hypothetical protein
MCLHSTIGVLVITIDNYSTPPATDAVADLISASTIFFQAQADWHSPNAGTFVGNPRGHIGVAIDHAVNEQCSFRLDHLVRVLGLTPRSTVRGLAVQIRAKVVSPLLQSRGPG